MTDDELLSRVSPLVADLLRALMDVRTLTVMYNHKANEIAIKAIQDAKAEVGKDD